MVFKAEKPKQGLVVTVKKNGHRKNGNGAVGGGRSGSTGKKAVIEKLLPNGAREEVQTVYGTSLKDLKKNLRGAGVPVAEIKIEVGLETHY